MDLKKAEMDREEQNNAKALEHPQRRVFFERLLLFLGTLWGVGLAAALVSYLKTPPHLRTARDAIEVGPLQDLAPGQSRLIIDSPNPFWVVRAASDEVIALPAVCTHRRCILEWDKTRRQMRCPCHGGIFDLKGNVLAGPPSRPLKPLSVSLKRGIIYVYA